MPQGCSHSLQYVQSLKTQQQAQWQDTSLMVMSACESWSNGKFKDTARSTAIEQFLAASKR